MDGLVNVVASQDGADDGSIPGGARRPGTGSEQRRTEQDGPAFFFPILPISTTLFACNFSISPLTRKKL